MAQVKFYSVSASAAKTDANGVYFVDGGELYKGTQRFGLGRVTVDAAFNPSTSSKDGQAKGDIVVTGAGAGWVYDGSAWQSVGGDTSSLQSMWQDDIRSWTEGLVAAGSGLYVTSIENDEYGKLKANVSNFATDVKTAVGNSTVSSTSNDVTVSVTTTSGKVTAVEVTAPAAKTWTAVNVGDANSYIYNVQQAADGQVSASAAAFPTLDTGDSDGEVKLGSDAAKVSGWDTVKTDITNLKAVVSYNGSGDSVVTASTGNFTNLNVTDTATFSATEVSAGSLTVGGVSVNNVAATSATGSDDGIAVTVSTLGGGVNAVGVAVTGNLATFAGKSVVTSVGPATGSGAASDDNIATEKAVRDAIATLTNVMHFRGVVTSLPTTAEQGDIVVIGSGATGELAEGQEYICTVSSTTAPTWEKIGDQSAVTGGGASDAENGITVSVAITAATAAPGVTLTVDAVEAAANVSDANKASNVVTAGAVNGFVTGITNTKASVGTSTTASTHGVSATMTLASNAAPTIGITVDAITASNGVSTGVDKVVTAGAVADYVTGRIGGLDANVSSSNQTGLTVSVTQADGVVTAVQAELAWLGADGLPI